MKWVLCTKSPIPSVERLKHKKSAGVRTKDGKLLTEGDGKNTFNEVLNIPCDIPIDGTASRGRLGKYQP